MHGDLTLLGKQSHALPLVGQPDCADQTRLTIPGTMYDLKGCVHCCLRSKMPTTIPHKDAWTIARDRFVEDLSEEEGKLYETASPESIFYSASVAEKTHASSSGSRSLAAKLGPLIAAIDQYGMALDVYANTYHLLLCPLWGSIRIILHLARAFSKYFERIVEMFARIGDLLPRFRIYENLFPSHERLVQAFSTVYVDILEFFT
ncbi:MAG: hypothetical protein Q9222_004640 [Ikaeria aurantiellina]